VSWYTIGTGHVCLSVWQLSVIVQVKIHIDGSALIGTYGRFQLRDSEKDSFRRLAPSGSDQAAGIYCEGSFP
jgi:hypothetical protein